MKKIKNYLLSIAALGLFLAPFAVVTNSSIAQDTKPELCKGVDLSFGSGDTQCKKGSPQRSINTLITQIVNILSIIVGIVAVIMIIIGGFKYITSSGDSGNISSAKNTVIYALVGLVIVALAQVIVRFVLQKSTTEG